ncbi:MAG: hypothetical protein H0T47_17820 [Planctomycetaceae bacterium]|nr:hypothetical protein [Planctomycetaceae bacterium]
MVSEEILREFYSLLESRIEHYGAALHAIKIVAERSLPTDAPWVAQAEVIIVERMAELRDWPDESSVIEFVERSRIAAGLGEITLGESTGLSAFSVAVPMLRGAAAMWRIHRSGGDALAAVAPREWLTFGVQAPLEPGAAVACERFVAVTKPGLATAAELRLAVRHDFLLSLERTSSTPPSSGAVGGPIAGSGNTSNDDGLSEAISKSAAALILGYGTTEGLRPNLSQYGVSVKAHKCKLRWNVLSAEQKRLVQVEIDAEAERRNRRLNRRKTQRTEAKPSEPQK